MKVSTVIFSTLLLLSSAGLAQSADYFPLDTGNVWMFRAAVANETAYRTISVEGREMLNDMEYFRVRYFERVVHLRSNADGSIVFFNRETGGEQPWLRLIDVAGTEFESHVDSCVNKGRIDSRGVEVATPAGHFNDTVRVGFEGRCADAGTTQQVYAAAVGPIVHEESSFAGPRRYELVYFRTSTTSGGASELSFTIGLDAPHYHAGDNIAVRLTLRSTHPDSIMLHFPSGQSFDFKISNEAGTIGYTWSADKLFPLIIRDEQFGPGERTFGFRVPLGTLPPGRYKAQGYLTTSPMLFLAETSFEIVP